MKTRTYVFGSPFSQPQVDGSVSSGMFRGSAASNQAPCLWLFVLLLLGTSGKDFGVRGGLCAPIVSSLLLLPSASPSPAWRTDSHLGSATAASLLPRVQVAEKEFSGPSEESPEDLSPSPAESCCRPLPCRLSWPPPLLCKGHVSGQVPSHPGLPSSVWGHTALTLGGFVC